MGLTGTKVDDTLTDNNAAAFELDYLCVAAENTTIKADRLSRTPGANPIQLAEFARLGTLWPPIPVQRSDQMPSALGLFRGESSEYLLVKAQQGVNGTPCIQFVMMPAAPLRTLAGNLRWLVDFARAPIPEAMPPRADLPRLVFRDPQPASEQTQIDDLLMLLTFCRNRVQTVGNLVAALVQRTGIGIVNAPLSITDRLSFVQGLLTLLPAPLRTGITFATNVLDPGRTNAQIKFLATETARPSQHLIFDWATGKLIGDAPDDIYTTFILSQFRLDPALVVEQTRALERTAAWRMSRKDDLPSALAWAARRASLDSALKNGLPGDPGMVAEVLHDDPSLSNETRLMYARYMLNVTLSLNEAERGDSLAENCIRYGYVADMIAQELLTALIDTAHAEAVIALLTRWLTANPNFDLGNARWPTLLSSAMLTHAQPIFDRDDGAAIRSLLEGYLLLSPTLRLDRAIAQLIGSSRKAAYADPQVMRALFLLAVTFLPANGLQRLLGDSQLTNRLPPPLWSVFAYLKNAPDGGSNLPPGPATTSSEIAPVGLLARACTVYSAEQRAVILSRLVEWALLIHRYDLLDADTLKLLVELGVAPQTTRFDVTTQQVVQDLSRLNALRTLDSRSQQYLVALSLVRQRYENAAAQIEFYQNTLYPGRGATEFTLIAQNIFQETPLDVGQMNSALEALAAVDLRVLVRAHAYLGALIGHDWSPALSYPIQQLTLLLSTDASAIQTLGAPHVLHLIKLNAERHDVMNTLKLSVALTETTLVMGDSGTAMAETLYETLNWGPEMSASALEMLRTFVRRAPLAQARTLTVRMGQRHGATMIRALDATFQLRQMLGSRDLNAYTERLAVIVPLLTDMAATYHESQTPPAMFKLRDTVQGMTGGGLSDDERQRLAQNLLRIAELILPLAKARTYNTPKQNATPLLLQNSLPPASGVDALRWIGGHFAAGDVFTPSLERPDQPRFFGMRSINVLLRETDTAVELLANLLTAFPENTSALDNQAFRSEVDSVWTLLAPATQRRTVDKLTENAQLLAELISIIGDKGSDRSLPATGYGRQLVSGRVQPRSVVDALCWVNGYFQGQHVT